MAPQTGPSSSTSARTVSENPSSRVAELLDTGGDVFDSDWEVFQARQPPSSSTVKQCDDCLRFTKHPTREGYYISTPNVEIIPQLPRKSSKIQYYEDGMLGSLEFFKWPQEHDKKCSFAFATPANPDLLTFKHQSFFIVDTHNALPQFADLNAPWFHIRERNFKTNAVFPTGQYGRLHDDVLNRMQSAVLEIVGFIEKSVKVVVERLRKLGQVERQGAQERHNLCQKLQTRLRQSFMKLFAGDMTPFETLLVFREFQRMLLALRAWVVYSDVFWPRLLDAESDFRHSPLPVRGLFTDDYWIVKEMYRIGVPVWYIRPIRSFLKWTVIVRSTPFISFRYSFSATTVMRMGQFQLNAPAWLREEEDNDPTCSSLIDRLERMSVSNQALIAATFKYDPNVASALYQNTVERAFDLDAGAPSLSMSNVSAVTFGNIEDVKEALAIIDRTIRDEEAAIPVEHVDVEPMNNAEVSFENSEGPSFHSPAPSFANAGGPSAAGPSQGAVAGPSHFTFTSIPPAAKSSLPPAPSFLPPRPHDLPSHPLATPDFLSHPPSVPGTLSYSLAAPHIPYQPLPEMLYHPVVGASSASLGAGSSQQSTQRRVAGSSRKQANRPAERAGWVPVETDGWAAALTLCDLVDHAEDRLLYAVPSPHMFCRYASDNQTGCRMLHRWLRIRLWCLRQILHGAQRGRVLMTREEWRMALDGNYYQLVDIDLTKCQAKASVEDICRLPVRAVQTKERNRVEGDKPSKRRRVDNNHNDRKFDKRLGTRLDINVRFGVHAGFPPLEDTDSNMWGGDEYTAQQLLGKGEVWAEIVWELSMVSFRLEVMQVDRALCADIYRTSDGAWERTNAAAHVWSAEGWVAPPWTYKEVEDDLSSDNVRIRRGAITRFARLMSVWPSVDRTGTHSLQQLLATSADILDVSHAVAVFTFYIRSAHSILGRLPTIPLRKPSTIKPTAAVIPAPNVFKGAHVNETHNMD
ncbi:hypothetical protein EUX98_g8418 [Antrodiella citrinella]|uniref:Uncharacterized protein n=1 Tax=Antrodiella citrinella TaxID=2447956 RepID=A0A4S4M866_9APHY|nr:hypothetical protein EUX98_g8418 [Antrodiella citrinella]